MDPNARAQAGLSGAGGPARSTDIHPGMAMVRSIRALAPVAAAVLVAAGAAVVGLAVGTPPVQRTAAACSVTEEGDDPILAADGYVQAVYRASCPDAITTGISLGLYHYPRRSPRGVLIAQSTCTAGGAIVECQVSALCHAGSWDVTVGTDAAWPPGTTPPDFGWVPLGAEWGVSACPPLVPGAQTVTLESAP